MKEFIESVVHTKLAETVITVVISVILYNVFKQLVNRGKKSKNLKNKIDNRQRTYLRLFNNVLKYAFIIVTLLIVLQINGVNVTSMLAGVGILSAVVGLSLQDALKDIIMGANIVTDDFFALGDVVKYKNIEGKVVSFGLKTTKIQDLSTNNIISITNRNINEIEKVSNKLYIDIPTSYEIKMAKLESIIPQMVDQINQIEHVEKCEYIGLTSFDETYIIYKLAIECRPEYKLEVKRYILRIIKKNLDDSQIETPFEKIDVHNV